MISLGFRTIKFSLPHGLFALFILLACLGLMRHAFASEQSEQQMEMHKRLLPGKVQEECLVVRKGEELTYRFTSDQPLEFNLHYHEKNPSKTIYLFGPSLEISEPKGHRYAAETTRLVCLMWTNQAESEVNLRYSHQIVEKN